MVQINGDELEPSVLYAARGEDLVCHTPELVGATLKHDHLEAEIVAQMDVQGRTNAIAEIVLQLR